MENINWFRQTSNKPLFPDLLWSKPENRSHAGKLGVVGGNAHGFAAAAEAYSEASKAGAGTVRVLLPVSLQKTVGRVFEAGEYAPSTPSGSFSQKALVDVLALADWADGLMLAGDFGNNSETTILLESLITKYSHQLTITDDALDYFIQAPITVLNRENTLLVLSQSQLQKLAIGAKYMRAFTSTMDMIRLVDSLSEFTKRYKPAIIVSFLENVIVAFDGKVSTTKIGSSSEISIATNAATWWMQNPSQCFEALTTSVI
jgi:NAD(P)H-hydrate repair Nnr-like enzyme with NAD(P)H-hydrate dehydratase domain